MAIEAHQTRWMDRALALARRGLGHVEPNPMVGCVLVRDEAVIGEGYHRRFGQTHAEVNAIAAAHQAGHDPVHCDVYVTLEPCAHHGKTPPCVDALLAIRPRRTVIAMTDPFEKVAGRGIERLREAGIDVVVGVRESEARKLNEAYLKRITRQQPWVIAKWAQTVDGRIATSTGDSKWISGDASRRAVHQLRARVDAIIVGIGTVLADDPRLTARGVGVRRVARRIIVDPDLRIPMDCQIVQSLTNRGGKRHVRARVPQVTMAVRQRVFNERSEKLVELEALGVEMIALPICSFDPRRLDLLPLMHHLCEHHAATNVLAEGGSALLGSLFAQKLVDQAIIYVAPKILGDPAGLSAINSAACERIEAAQKLSPPQVRRIGDDIVLDYRVI